MKTALAYATLALAILAAFALALAMLKKPADDSGLKGKAEERRNQLEEAAKQLSR